MKLACADFSLPLLEHEQALDLIRMLGVEGFDLAVMDNRYDLTNTDNVAETILLRDQIRRKPAA